MSDVNYLRRSLGAPVGIVSASLNAVAKLGYDTDLILEKCGIAPEELADIGNRVTGEQFGAFNTYLLGHTNLSGVGLLQGSAEKLMDYGLIGVAFISSDNLGMALTLVERYRPLFGPICDFHIELQEEEIVIVCEGKDPSPLYRRKVEAALAAFVSAIRDCIPETVNFSVVRLTYPAPEYISMYEDIFQCPAVFEQQRNELRLPKAYLDIPFKAANAELRKICLRECDKTLHGLKTESPLIEQIEAIIRSFSGSLPQFPLIAETLKISPRTLHRRLADEGITYRQIVENLRKQLAKEYLTEAKLEQKEVAYLLGYTEPANFYHAFQRWFGCTPTEFMASR